MSQLADGHDNFCNCWCPFAHLLASIFPPGHQDRDLTINQIIQRDYKEQCHSGGTEEESHGIQLGESAATLPEEKEGQDTKEDIEDLILAAAAAAGERER